MFHHATLLSKTLKILLPSVSPTPRSLATTCRISVDFFSSPYLDVSVQAVPYIYLCIQYMLMEYCSIGFPHSGIHGSKLAFSSPWLIADCYVLLRLLLPSMVVSEGPALLFTTLDVQTFPTARSEERRVGKECLRLCRSRWSPYH